MRFCFYTSANSLQGGAERLQVLIVEHLVRQGHDVHVVLPQESDLTQHYRNIGANMHVMYWQHLQRINDPVHVARYLFWLPIITLRLAKLLWCKRIQVLHVNEILDFQGLVAARLVGVPSVAFVRIILPSAIFRRVLRFLALLLADRVVPTSHAAHRMALNGVRHRKIRVIHDGGPDLDVFNPETVKPIRPESAGDALVIGLVSKLVREKGHLVFLELAARLRGRLPVDPHFVVVGGEVPGHEAYAAEVRDQIRSRGLEHLVHLVGKQSDVAGFVAGWDIVCHLPLVEDCFPAVPMESAVMRKPVVAFRAGGIPEQLTHPTTIRLVTMGDVDDLEKQVLELLRDADLRRQMGDAARNEVLNKFSLEKHRAITDAMYRELAFGSCPLNQS